MIGYLKGKILSLTADTALIETGGVGYEVLCSASALSSLSGKSEGELYTYLQVREDGISLFGFSSPAEKNMFLKLVSVSGVGPKMGIAVLSGMDINSLAVAIASSDVKKLSTVKGLGKKTAERIILELREKVAEDAAAAPAAKARRCRRGGRGRRRGAHVLRLHARGKHPRHCKGACGRRVHDRGRHPRSHQGNVIRHIAYFYAVTCA